MCGTVAGEVDVACKKDAALGRIERL